MKRAFLIISLFCFSLFLSAQVSKTINVTAGNLSASLTSTERSTITNLTLTGTIDARDFKTMRDDMPVLADIDLSGASIAGYSGSLGTNGTSDLTYPANTIPNKSFYNKKSLNSIILPSTANSVGSFAFTNCNQLTNVVIPSTISKLGGYAFYCCLKLNSITLPSAVTFIGGSAFSICGAVINVDINNPNYSSIDGILFNKNKTTLIQFPYYKTGSYIIPESVTNLRDSAFFSCNKLTSLTIPSGLTTIGNQTFSGCSGLTSINSNTNSPINLASKWGVFSGIDKSLCTISVPLGSKAAYQAANQWKDFQNIVEMGPTFEMPLTVTAGGLASLLPQAVRDTLTYLALTGTIDARDFKTMRDSLPVLANIDMSRANILEHIGTEGTSEFVTTYAGNAIPDYAFWNRSTHKELVNIRTFVFPGNVNSIGTNAFRFCSGLSSISIPESVVFIGSQAFQNCDGIVSLNLPQNLTSISNSAFSSCENLETVNYPNQLKSIGETAFSWCPKLAMIKIPATVTSIGGGAFSNCTALSSIYAEPQTPPEETISNNGTFDFFYGVNKSTCKLNVALGSVSKYAISRYWKDFQNIIEMEPLVTMPLTVAAGGLASLLPQAVRDTLTYLALTGTIDARDFKTMRDSLPILANIDLSGVNIEAYSGTGGTSIIGTTAYPANTVPENAFYSNGGKASLISVKLSDNITEISREAFLSCNALQMVNLPNNLITIAYRAFGWCSNFSGITIPPSVKYIGDGAFSTTNISSLNIPASTEYVGSAICYQSRSLTQINVDPSNTKYSSITGVLFNKDHNNLMVKHNGKHFSILW